MGNDYSEIKELYKYCQKLKIGCKLEKFIDGYTILFQRGDCVQHKFSYGSKAGCVEFAVDVGNINYRAITLTNAKRFVKRWKVQLSSSKYKKGEQT